MNLYFRLLWLILRLPFMAKPKDALSPTSLFFRVWPNDLDFNMHMNNGRYLTIMDLGRLHLTFQNGLLGPSLKRKWMPVLGAAKIHYIKPLNPFEKYELSSKVIYWDDKWIYLEQHFYKLSKPGKPPVLAATALLKALFVGKEGKITPDQILSLVPNPPPKPMVPEHLERWLVVEKRDDF